MTCKVLYSICHLAGEGLQAWILVVHNHIRLNDCCSIFRHIAGPNLYFNCVNCGENYVLWLQVVLRGGGNQHIILPFLL
jgi:hypothetical protein